MLQARPNWSSRRIPADRCFLRIPRKLASTENIGKCKFLSCVEVILYESYLVRLSVCQIRDLLSVLRISINQERLMS